MDYAVVPPLNLNRKNLMMTDPRRYPLVSGGQVNVFRWDGSKKAPFGNIHQVMLPGSFDNETTEARNRALRVYDSVTMVSC